MTALLWVVAILLVLVGIAGTILPALPGTILVFAGLVLAAWADGFARVGWPSLVLIGLLTAISYVVDLLAAAAGVRRFGASKRAAVGAAVGTLLGLFFGLPGLIVGPFAGALLGEIWARRGLEGAGRAGIGAWLGFLVGAVLKIAIAFMMVGLFVAALFL
ncbi:MAG TPA: DUF456 domain-containing protein [Vicinamibacterales bacterium]|nr:DUF456 domain-containing protein [Vicinamibacterales bacterium]